MSLPERREVALDRTEGEARQFAILCLRSDLYER